MLIVRLARRAKKARARKRRSDEAGKQANERRAKFIEKI